MRVAGELSDIEGYLAANLFSWLRVDSRVEASGKVTAFVDKVNPGVGARAIDANHGFTQATGPQQVAAPTSDAALNNCPSCTFTGTQWYDTTIAGSFWKNHHDGTGGMRFYVVVPNVLTSSNLLAATINSGTLGCQDVLSTPDVMSQAIYNASTSIGSLNATGLVVGTGYFVGSAYSESDSPKVTTWRNNVAFTGPTTGAPSASNPSFKMRIGTRGDTAVPLKGRLAEAVFASTTSPALVAKLSRYFYLRYGLS